MPDETQDQKEKGPLPRSREAVDWWLKKWGRDSVVEGIEPLTREDVERLIGVNGGTAQGLDLFSRNMQGIDLIRVNLEGANLTGATLKGAQLRGANLRAVHMSEVDLSEAYLQEAGLHEAILLTSDLCRADLVGADLQGAALADACLFETKLSGANLKDASLDNSDLRSADLQYADLQGASLYRANLHGASLDMANLQGADLWEANLQGADLRWAKLQGASLAGAIISPDTNLEGVEWDLKYISAPEQRGNYEAASEVYRRLKEWHRARGMLTIAGEFHYREQEASRKAKGQRLVRQFKAELAAAWRRLKGKDTSASPERALAELRKRAGEGGSRGRIPAHRRRDDFPC
jgi:uncharacterized protein YjbI with pentapeptide repeats